MTEDRYVIIGKPGCPWCDKVADLLFTRDKKFTYLKITSPGDPLRTFLYDNGLKTVPQVFTRGWLLGGYEATKDYLDGIDAKNNVPADRLPYRDSRGADHTEDQLTLGY